MNSIKLSAKSKTLIVLIISFAALAIYIISLRFAYPVFQNTQLSQPLASLQALFPLFYTAILILASATILNMIFNLSNRALNIWLLIVFAAMLWYTPHILAGTTYQLDGLKCIAVSDYIPQIFQGQNVITSIVTYSRQYPASFILHWILIRVMGVDSLAYLNIIFPLIYVILFVLFTYLIVKKLFNDRIAFLSILLASPGLHYVQIYPSPHALGMLMTLAAVFFVIRKDFFSIMLSALIVVAAVFAHPISPLILLIFMGSFLLATLIKERAKWQIALSAATVFCFILWFLLYTSVIKLVPETVSLTEPLSPVTTVAETVKIDMLSRTLNYLFGNAFIYDWIYSLARDIYFAYAGIAIILIAIFVFLSYKRIRSFSKFITILGGMQQNQIFFLLCAILLLLLTLLLGAYRLTSYDLIERSLTVLILTISITIASLLFDANMKFYPGVKYTCFSIFLVIFTLTFPVVSYSKDAYTSMPLSEKFGLDYVNDSRLLPSRTTEGKEVIIPEYQIAHSPNFHSVPANPDDLYIFRMTGYYYYSMRINLSFTNNQYLKLKENVINSLQYNCIYANRTTSIYMRH